MASLKDEKAELERELADKGTVTNAEEHSFDAEAAIADYYHVRAPRGWSEASFRSVY